MKHILVCDEDGHWYVIPKDKQDDFDSWIDQFDEDGIGPDLPDWADEVGGSYILVEFEKYTIG